MSPQSLPVGKATEVRPAGAVLYELTSILEPFAWDRLYAVTRAVEVELGCGDGGFLVEAARAHPQVNYLGIERLLGRIRKVDRKGRRLGLENLRAVRIEAAYGLQYLLPPVSVQALHVYFPDPWPKAKHQRHRLINSFFPGLARRVLVSGGRVYLRTDDEAYYLQMRAVFGADPGFREVQTPSELAEITTDFEREYVAAGRVVYRAAYEWTP